MSSSGEKTEEATPQKLQKARERGEVFQSKDLTGAALLAGAAAVISGQIADVSAAFASVSRTLFEAAPAAPHTGAAMLTHFGAAALEGFKALIPLLGVLLALAVLIPFFQVGPLLSFGPLAPKLSKLNPISGIKKTMFSMQAYIELIKAALKVTVVAVIFWIGIKAELRNVLMLGTQAPEVAGHTTMAIAGKALTRTILFFIAIGILDFMYQRWQFHKGMRMSKEEIKQEYKEQEGDPHHKSHRKQLHEELASESMLNHARKADAIVTNPTHLACALRYDPKEEDAPRLLAKGKGWIAERLREIAKEEDIPIVRDVSLARALFTMELEEEVPEELFDAVAEVLKWVETVLKAEGALPRWLQPREEGEDGQAE
ncbi:MAG TPA: EscU/YscU/HrcU family type III secretion system export apparatus switch protein [Tepidisphaeraceae bacterium]|nr:EscU/YscU/HrcU family type III secretion system export apparatus switch protein [Tepidisphaeraceae bacterium]